MEQNGPELELLWLQIETLVAPCLPTLTFIVGILLARVVLRLLPGYDDTCSSINHKLHAPKSVVELLEYSSTPGEFPITASQKMIDDFNDLLSTKDKEIARLRNNLQQEDQELVDLLAQNDEEISDRQSALQLRDKKISDLQDVKMRFDRRAASKITQIPPPPVSSITSQ